MIAPRFAYRLTEWPDLAPAEKTAHVLRAFSRMTLVPVTAAWFVANSRMNPACATRLLQRLSDAGALERIDFGPGSAEASPEPHPATPSAPARRWGQAARNCTAAGSLAVLALVSSGQGVLAEPLACRSPQAAAGSGAGG